MEKHVFDPVLTHFWSPNGSFSRHFGIFHDPKRATRGSKRPKNTCLSIPSGLGKTLKKIIFFAPGPAPQNSLFSPQTAPKPTQNRQSKGNNCYTPRAPPLPRDKGPFLPSSSAICPRNAPQMAKNGVNVRCLCQTGRNPQTGRILGYVAQNRIPRAPSPPTTPHFLWFPSLRMAQRDA